MGGDDHDERPGPDWGDNVARKTFNATLILAILYVAAVFIFVMR